MMQVDLFDLRDDDLAVMCDRIQPMDRFEFDVMSGGKRLDECFNHLRRRSVRARAAYADGELVAVYGVLAPTLMAESGNPWLAATPTVDRPDVRREFIRYTEREMTWLSEGFQHLWNLVSHENQVAIRWLKWIGFQFDDDLIDVRGHPFRRFSMGE